MPPGSGPQPNPSKGVEESYVQNADATVYSQDHGSQPLTSSQVLEFMPKPAGNVWDMLRRSVEEPHWRSESGVYSGVCCRYLKSFSKVQLVHAGRFQRMRTNLSMVVVEQHAAIDADLQEENSQEQNE